MEYMIGGNNSIIQQLTTVYSDSVKLLSSEMAKLASGKNFQNAADNLRVFTNNVNLEIAIKGYEEIRLNLANAKTITSAAVDSGSIVYENLKKMKKYVTDYIGEASGANDPVKLAQYKAGFDSLKESVVSSLHNAYVDEILVTRTATPVKEVMLDLQNNSQLTIEFSAVADENNIRGFNVTTMTDTSGIETEISNALTFLSESRSYNAIIDRQMEFTGLIVKGKGSLQSLITGIDEAKVITEVIDRSVRLEAVGAMIAQGNMITEGVISLYGW